MTADSLPLKAPPVGRRSEHPDNERATHANIDKRRLAHPQSRPRRERAC